MPSRLAPLAAAILDEHGIIHRVLIHPYKLKASERMHEVHYLARYRVVLHLGSKRSCEEYAYSIYRKQHGIPDPEPLTYCGIDIK